MIPAPPFPTCPCFDCNTKKPWVWRGSFRCFECPDCGCQITPFKDAAGTIIWKAVNRVVVYVESVARLQRQMEVPEIEIPTEPAP